MLIEFLMKNRCIMLILMLLLMGRISASPVPVISQSDRKRCNEVIDGVFEVEECSSWYLKCIRGQPLHLTCQDPLIFDEIAKECNHFDKVVSCEEKELTREGRQLAPRLLRDKQKQDETITAYEARALRCYGQPDGPYAVHSCSQYFTICESEKASTFNCGPGLYFHDDNCSPWQTIKGCESSQKRDGNPIEPEEHFVLPLTEEKSEVTKSEEDKVAEFCVGKGVNIAFPMGPCSENLVLCVDNRTFVLECDPHTFYDEKKELCQPMKDAPQCDILQWRNNAWIKPDEAAYPTYRTEDPPPIPKSFDARYEAFHECADLIGSVKQQGACGSCFAVTATSVMSDRLCIATEGKVKVTLSANHLMSCCEECSPNRCAGGSAMSAFEFYQNNGIVSGGEVGTLHGCQAYTFKGPGTLNYFWSDLMNRIKNITPDCKENCDDGSAIKNFKKDLYYGRKPKYLHPSYITIQREILNNGPVHAGLLYYADLGTHKSGVYEHNRSLEPDGAHALKLIGWGTTPAGKAYWLAINTWGTDAHEKGVLKIRRGTNECNMERSVLAGLPDDGKSRIKRRRVRRHHDHHGDGHLHQSSKGGRHQHFKLHKRTRHTMYQSSSIPIVKSVAIERIEQAFSKLNGHDATKCISLLRKVLNITDLDEKFQGNTTEFDPDIEDLIKCEWLVDALYANNNMPYVDDLLSRNTTEQPDLFSSNGKQQSPLMHARKNNNKEDVGICDANQNAVCQSHDFLNYLHFKLKQTSCDDYDKTVGEDNRTPMRDLDDNGDAAGIYDFPA